MAGKRGPARIRSLVLVMSLVAVGLGAALPQARAGDPVGLRRVPKPIDPQSWVFPQDMTWSDHQPVPGYDWTDPGFQPEKKLTAALILGDFQDRDFIMTIPRGSDEADNPKAAPVPREEVAEFYEGFLLNEPQALNRFHDANEYWLEVTYGVIGIDADSFGPYRLEGKEHEYGLQDYAGGSCPEGDDCSRDFDTEVAEASLVDVNAAIAENGTDYDFRFLLHAGYDESGVWQEFGEMRFLSPEHVTEAFGNPDPAQPNWADTRYIDWTSWWAAQGIWSHAVPGVLSTQGENDGGSTYAHEFSHILGVLDNYNNPYANPVRRAYGGPWDMMDRGTFNGPGGPHNRWQIPPTRGGTMGPHHMLRNKLRMGFLKPGEVMVTSTDALAQTGPLFADVWARAIPVGPTEPRQGLHGIQVVLPNGDQSPSCSVAQDWRCDGGGYNNYTLEVVDRIGVDSFTPDHGVLLAKTKNADTSPFIWTIDSHPEDIELVDFTRPDGSVAMASLGDYRQLSDSLFHAGTGPDVVSEYVDEPNGLHFYVLDIQRDDERVLSYRVAVRSLDGDGPFTRGVTIGEEVEVDQASPGRIAVARFQVTNTGNATDLFRVVPSMATRTMWASTPRNVIEVAAGDTVEVPVYVQVAKDARGLPRKLTFTVTSETDPTKTATTNVQIRPVM